MDFVGQALECLETGGVDGGHVAKTEDDDFGQRGDFLANAIEFFAGTEEEGTVNAKDGDVAGQDLVLKNVKLSLYDVLFGDARDGGGQGHFADVDQRGEDHSGFNGDGKICEDGKEQGYQPYSDLHLWKLENDRDLVPFAHVVADNHQDGGENRQRDESREGSCKEQHGEYGERMDHAGYGRLCAGPNVGCSSGDCASCGKAAEERRGDVGDSLCDQLHARIVLVSAHAIGDYCGHERFDGSEKRDGDGWGDQRSHGVVLEDRRVEVWEAGWNAAKSSADGFYVEVEKVNSGGSGEERNDVARNATGKA